MTRLAFIALFLSMYFAGYASGKEAHGCYEEYFIIECEPFSVIELLTGWHGQFASCAEGQCCQPSEALDCRELMAEHDEQDWDQLKQKCNFNQICTVYNHGGVLASCDSPYTSDYAQVKYVCIGI